MTLSATAGLAGISPAYLSMIERGLRPVTKRNVLEGLASALRVSPSDLTGKPYAPTDPVSDQAHAALNALETVLTEWWPDEVPDGDARPWPVLEAELRAVNEQLRPRSDYAGMGTVLPGLIHDLLIHAADPNLRRHALVGLVHAYHAAGRVVWALGAVHLAHVAAERVHSSALALGDPEWLGLAAYTRAQYLSSRSRPRQYALALVAADMPHTRLETRGMGHLVAALAAAAQKDAQTAAMHLDEADRIADKLGVANSAWGGATLNFGKTNVGIWRVSLGVELGLGAKVAEIARGVAWREIPVSRQGAYWIDLGRGLLQEKRTQAQGLHALLTAEELTPQQVRNNAFVREAVSTLLYRTRREAGDRELRGLAYRMGVAPIGRT
ncbi:Transcriptional regulator, contains XRE-family HTH domain [Streptoalloteichus tenebrarius]|uniref:Transcriptional regulator, contains XRE-family HTH domain n=2 Tax=Streptoalloteichus tenebrarius (strain ATCC 17920 / DSM 40477 / JCM 4838 / CBS 697.72 / NBRC 16177 / NCIMB 11028 / NRRL B-12390 / A12253. 1 / ISP 5477) TaxID=1933 RepID=A0ABT1HPM0_STRSD|nr:Transcriptional regulator, contains XRE-family HTH domain [Streptoalloteichus tenebrarius]